MSSPRAAGQKAQRRSRAFTWAAHGSSTVGSVREVVRLLPRFLALDCTSRTSADANDARACAAAWRVEDHLSPIDREVDEPDIAACWRAISRRAASARNFTHLSAFSLMMVINRISRNEERKAFVLATIQRLQRPVCMADLSPRASEHGVYDKAFRELLAEGRIVVDRIGSRRVKFYALPSSQQAGNQAERSAEPGWP
jgi:hypothetical protein